MIASIFHFTLIKSIILIILADSKVFNLRHTILIDFYVN